VEVLVSDGGSTDQTIPLAKTRADVVIERLPEAAENISIGRNHGAKYARGEVLIFLNANVKVGNVEEFFRRILATIENDHVVAVTCNVLIDPQEERLIDKLFHKFFNNYFYLLNVFGIGMGRGECHIMKRGVFEKIGGYNEILAAGEDYEMFLRLCRLGKIAYLRDLNVYESPRRYRRYGYFWILFLWFMNGIWAMLFKRSFSHQWKPVR
jgi:glycosyltransferase involved in cell wall biosynthesis